MYKKNSIATLAALAMALFAPLWCDCAEASVDQSASAQVMPDADLARPGKEHCAETDSEGPAELPDKDQCCDSAAATCPTLERADAQEPAPEATEWPSARLAALIPSAEEGGLAPPRASMPPRWEPQLSLPPLFTLHGAFLI